MKPLRYLIPYAFPGHTLPLLIVRIACCFGLFSYAWNVGDHMRCDCGMNLAGHLRGMAHCPGACGIDGQRHAVKIHIASH